MDALFLANIFFDRKRKIEVSENYEQRDPYEEGSLHWWVEWVAAAVVGDPEVGAVEAGHVDGAGVQHLFWPQAERVAVDGAVGCWEPVVRLVGLYLPVVHGGELCGAGVVVDDQGCGGEGVGG